MRAYEHPAVTSALRYGYPARSEKHFCIICNAPATCWGSTSGYRCFNCAKAEFEELTDEEAVELLGFEVIEDV